MINYQTATAEEITSFIDGVITKTAEGLEDSPKSKSFLINNTIGFFQGVMAARGFNYDYYDLCKWSDLARQ